MQDGQKYCHECSAANEWGNSEPVPTPVDTVESKTLLSLEEQQKSDDAPLPQEQSMQPAQSQEDNLCTRCQAPIEDGQEYCPECVEDVNWGNTSSDFHRSTGFHNPDHAPAPVLDTWKTSVGFSLLGFFVGFPLLILVSLLAGSLLFLVALLIVPTPLDDSLAMPLGVAAGWILQIIYAAKFYPSYFTEKPMLKSSKAISFANLMFGGVIFGWWWNMRLTQKIKGVSHIVCVVLQAIGLAWLVIGLLLTIFLGTTSGQAETTGVNPPVSPPPIERPDAPIRAAESLEAPRVKIEIEDYGDIILELDRSAAPLTVDNFLRLADGGFYDGLTFHRIIDGFIIQGGDPEGTGMGGSGTSITGEFAANGIENPISHRRGVVSMARAADFNSASSQFFIVHQDATFLDGEYAGFGRVIEGMEIIDVIAQSAPVADENGTVAPADQPVITRIVIAD